jgi:hypothetical protein
MNKYLLLFATVTSIVCILFLITVNLLTSPHIIWFIHPAIAIILWPISLYSIQKNKSKLFSIIVSLILIVYLVIENYTNTPDYPWFLYAAYPIIWWPILVSLGKYAKYFSVSIFGSMCTILYYSFLNIFLSPQYPWAIYPAFAVLWWPLSIYYAKTKRYFEFSIVASIFISIFFITVNIVSTPFTIWAVYPIFAVIWWPLSMYFYSYKRRAL